MDKSGDLAAPCGSLQPALHEHRPAAQVLAQSERPGVLRAPWLSRHSRRAAVPRGRSPQAIAPPRRRQPLVRSQEPLGGLAAPPAWRLATVVGVVGIDAAPEEVAAAVQPFRAGRESRVLRALLIVVEQHLAKHWPDRRATSSQERDQFLLLLI